MELANLNGRAISEGSARKWRKSGKNGPDGHNEWRRTYPSGLAASTTGPRPAAGSPSWGTSSLDRRTVIRRVRRVLRTRLAVGNHFEVKHCPARTRSPPITMCLCMWIVGPRRNRRNGE